MNELEVFHPDRMASRILGMGDMMTLIEEAESKFDEAQAIELEKKIKKNQFTLDDFLSQMQQVKKLGGLGKIISMLPGQNTKEVKDTKLAYDSTFGRFPASVGVYDKGLIVNGKEIPIYTYTD